VSDLSHFESTVIGLIFRQAAVNLGEYWGAGVTPGKNSRNGIAFLSWSGQGIVRLDRIRVCCRRSGKE